MTILMIDLASYCSVVVHCKHNEHVPTPQAIIKEVRRYLRFWNYRGSHSYLNSLLHSTWPFGGSLRGVRLLQLDLENHKASTIGCNYTSTSC